MHAPRTLFLYGLVIASMSGCSGGMVLDRATLNADLPLAPPAVMPDSSKPGDLALQVAARVSDGNFFSDRTHNWTSYRLGGYGQAQFKVTKFLRFVVGGGQSSTTSLWGGVTVSDKLGEVRYDLDLLYGSTRASHLLEGHYPGYGYNPEDTSHSVAFGTTWSGWSQFAIRVRHAGNSPWAEVRYLPSFNWGRLRDHLGYDNEIVSTSTFSIAAGWVQNLEDGSLFLVGPRANWTNSQSIPDIQLTASAQIRLRP